MGCGGSSATGRTRRKYERKYYEPDYGADNVEVAKVVLPVNVYTHEHLETKYRIAASIENDYDPQPALVQLIDGSAVVVRKPPEAVTNDTLCTVKLTLDSGTVVLRVPEEEVVDASEVIGLGPEITKVVKLLRPRLTRRKVRDFKLRYVGGVSRAVKIVAMNNEESMFIAGGNVGMIAQNNIEVTDARTLQKVANLPVQCYPITGAEFTTSCQMLLTCDNTFSINMWDMNTFHIKRTIDAPEADGLKEYRFACLRVTPNNMTVLAAGEEITSARSRGVVMGWSLSSPSAPTVTFAEHSERVHGLCVSSSGRMVVTCDRSGTVYVWLLGTAEVVHALEMPGSSQFVCFSADGTRVAAVCERAIGVWDTETGDPVMSRHLERGTARACPTCFAEQTSILLGDRYLVMCSVPGGYLFCSTSFNLIIIYDLETLEEVVRYPVKSKVVSASPSRSKVTFGDVWGNVGFLEVV